MIRRILQLLSPGQIKRSFLLGTKSLWMHRLRSLLTALGIVFGVASVIAMLAIGEGASFEAQEQIRQLGSQNVIVESVLPTDSANDEADQSRGIEYGLKYRDLRQIQNTIPEVRLTVPAKKQQSSVWHGAWNVECEIMGTVPEFFDTRGLKLRRGRLFSPLEMEDRRNVAVIDEGTARKLFPLEDPIGSSLRVGADYFRVVGILEQVGGGNAGKEGEQNADLGRLLVPLSAFLERFGEINVKRRVGSVTTEKVEIHEFTAMVRDVEKVVPTANAIRRVLAMNREEGEYRITVPVELLKQAEKTRRIFNTVLGSIAAISLLVGGIGIMNIMLATVTERTREIGIRRALGARQGDIVFQFLVETVLLSGAGGVLGVALGLIVPAVVGHFTGMQTLIQLWAPTLAFSISLAVGILFGIYPAMRAARMNPVEALRHE